jgi:hypothetical protein
MLALAFAPISLFFLITAPDYSFFKLLNVAILALSALVGLRFLTSGMRVLNEHGLLAPEKPAAIPVSPAPAGAPEHPVPLGAAASLAPEAVGNGGAVALAPPVLHQAPPGYVIVPVRQQYVRQVKPQSAATPPSMALLYIWILLFGFVGTQLAWTLRPFFGSPGVKFSLYREIGGNFYAEIFRTLSHLF